MTLLPLIQSDLHRYCGRTGLKWFVAEYIMTPRFRWLVALRVCQSLRQLSSVQNKRRWRMPYLVSRLWLGLAIRKHLVEATPGTRIGYGLSLGKHYGSTIFNGKCVIGNNCNIAHNVTIGTIPVGERKGAPRLGDRVWVSPGAIVVGGITIGDGAVIGPGAMVNFDVPPNAVVLGNPGKVVSMRGSDGYCIRKWEG